MALWDELNIELNAKVCTHYSVLELQCKVKMLIRHICTLNWDQNSHCVFKDSSVSIILSSNNSSGIGNILLQDARLFRFVLACSVSPRVDYKDG